MQIFNQGFNNFQGTNTLAYFDCRWRRKNVKHSTPGPAKPSVFRGRRNNNNGYNNNDNNDNDNNNWPQFKFFNRVSIL
jgi:hypothetical protein